MKRSYGCLSQKKNGEMTVSPGIEIICIARIETHEDHAHAINGRVIHLHRAQHTSTHFLKIAASAMSLPELTS